MQTLRADGASFREIAFQLNKLRHTTRTGKPWNPTLLSVTTFWSFLREFSPLGVCGSGIRNFMMIRSRVSVDVAGLHRESRRDSNVVVSMFAVI